MKNIAEKILLVGALGLSFGGVSANIMYLHPAEGAASDPGASLIASSDLRHDLYELSPSIRDFTDKENLNDIHVIDDHDLQNKITDIRLAIKDQHYIEARHKLDDLKSGLVDWNKQLDGKIADKQTEAQRAKLASQPAPAPIRTVQVPSGLIVPILLYHYTPNDFETDLQYLTRHGYHTITPDQLAAALYSHAALPSKPLLITFDDGFSNQMQAFELLKKYGMKATFYIITGGPHSSWCIGANRTNTSCGDSYLTWDQIQTLDESGYITIGCHTVDHANLASLPPDTQRYEIDSAKQELESHLGHRVTTFAYPYGSYNQTTVQIVREEGFSTAVTTLPGTIQSASRGLTLYRVRVALSLP